MMIAAFCAFTWSGRMKARESLKSESRSQLEQKLVPLTTVAGKFQKEFFKSLLMDAPKFISRLCEVVNHLRCHKHHVSPVASVEV